MDGEAPDCEQEGKECHIPPIPELALKAMELKSRIQALEGLIPGGDVLRLYGGYYIEDLNMLVFIENELRQIDQERKKDGAK